MNITMNFDQIISKITLLKCDSTEEDPEDIKQKCLRFREYFGELCQQEDVSFEGRLLGLGACLRQYGQLCPRWHAVCPQPADQLGHEVFLECARVILGVEFQRLPDNEEPRSSFRAAVDDVVRIQRAGQSSCEGAGPLGDGVGPLGGTEAGQEFQVLPWLMEHYWSHTTLVQMMKGEELEEDTALTYLEMQEHPAVFKLRIEMLVEGGCESYALNLCNWCVRSSVFSQDVWVRQTQLLLLHKFGRLQEFHNQCWLLQCCTALRVIKDTFRQFKITTHDCRSVGCCTARKVMEAMFEREERQSVCLMLAQTFLLQDWMQPNTYCCTKELLRLWILAQRLEEQEDNEFLSSVSKVANFARSTRQIASLVNVMCSQFGSRFRQFCTEQSVRALRMDRHKLDSARISKKDEEADVAADGLARTCRQIAYLYSDHLETCLASLVTALYLDPKADLFFKVEAIFKQDWPDEEEAPENVEEDVFKEMIDMIEALRPTCFNHRSSWTELRKMAIFHLEEAGFRYDTTRNKFRNMETKFRSAKAIANKKRVAKTIQPAVKLVKEASLVDEASATSAAAVLAAMRKGSVGDLDSATSQFSSQLPEGSAAAAPQPKPPEPGGDEVGVCEPQRESSSQRSMEALSVPVGKDTGTSEVQSQSSHSSVSQQATSDRDTSSGKDIESDDGLVFDLGGTVRSNGVRSGESLGPKCESDSTSQCEGSESQASVADAKEPAEYKEATEGGGVTEATPDSQALQGPVSPAVVCCSHCKKSLAGESSGTEGWGKVLCSECHTKFMDNHTSQPGCQCYMCSYCLPKTENPETPLPLGMAPQVATIHVPDDPITQFQQEQQQQHSNFVSQVLETVMEPTAPTYSLDQLGSLNVKPSEEVLKVEDKLDTTVHTEESRGKYECTFCAKGFLTMAQRRRHQEWVCPKKVQSGPCTYACEQCGNSFPMQSSLKKHIARVHGWANMPVEQVLACVKLPDGLKVTPCQVVVHRLSKATLDKYNITLKVKKKRLKSVDKKPRTVSKLVSQGSSESETAGVAKPRNEMSQCHLDKCVYIDLNAPIPEDVRPDCVCKYCGKILKERRIRVAHERKWCRKNPQATRSRYAVPVNRPPLAAKAALQAQPITKKTMYAERMKKMKEETMMKLKKNKEKTVREILLQKGSLVEEGFEGIPPLAAPAATAVTTATDMNSPGLEETKKDEYDDEGLLIMDLETEKVEAQLPLSQPQAVYMDQPYVTVAAAAAAAAAVEQPQAVAQQLQPEDEQQQLLLEQQTGLVQPEGVVTQPITQVVQTVPLLPPLRPAVGAPTPPSESVQPEATTNTEPVKQIIVQPSEDINGDIGIAPDGLLGMQGWTFDSEEDRRMFETLLADPESTEAHQHFAAKSANQQNQGDKKKKRSRPRPKKKKEATEQPAKPVIQSPVTAGPQTDTSSVKPGCICEFCGKEFKQRRIKVTHQKRYCHQNPRPREAYACETCGKKVYGKIAMENHHRLKHNQVAYICENCETVFLRFSQLDEHCRSEHKLSPYTCEYCGKKVFGPRTFERHRYTHARQENSCERCGLQIVGLRAMEIHHRTKHCEMPFICEFCGEELHWLKIMENHRQAHINGDIEADGLSESNLKDQPKAEGKDGSGVTAVNSEKKVANVLSQQGTGTQLPSAADSVPSAVQASYTSSSEPAQTNAQLISSPFEAPVVTTGIMTLPTYGQGAESSTVEVPPGLTMTGVSPEKAIPSSMPPKTPPRTKPRGKSHSPISVIKVPPPPPYDALHMKLRDTPANQQKLTDNMTPIRKMITFKDTVLYRTIENRCEKCKRVFDYKLNAQKHQEKECDSKAEVTTTRIWQCRFCEKSYSFATSCYKHMTTECDKYSKDEDTALLKFPCSQCAKIFMTALSLRGHILSKHAHIPEEGEEEGKPSTPQRRRSSSSRRRPSKKPDSSTKVGQSGEGGEEGAQPAVLEDAAKVLVTEGTAYQAVQGVQQFGGNTFQQPGPIMSTQVSQPVQVKEEPAAQNKPKKKRKPRPKSPGDRRSPGVVKAKDPKEFEGKDPDEVVRNILRSLGFLKDEDQTKEQRDHVSTTSTTASSPAISSTDSVLSQTVNAPNTGVPPGSTEPLAGGSVVVVSGTTPTAEPGQQQQPQPSVGADMSKFNVIQLAMQCSGLGDLAVEDEDTARGVSPQVLVQAPQHPQDLAVSTPQILVTSQGIPPTTTLPLVSLPSDGAATTPTPSQGQPLGDKHETADDDDDDESELSDDSDFEAEKMIAGPALPLEKLLELPIKKVANPETGGTSSSAAPSAAATAPDLAGSMKIESEDSDTMNTTVNTAELLSIGVQSVVPPMSDSPGPTPVSAAGPVLVTVPGQVPAASQQSTVSLMKPVVFSSVTGAVTQPTTTADLQESFVAPTPQVQSTAVTATSVAMTAPASQTTKTPSRSSSSRRRRSSEVPKLPMRSPDGKLIVRHMNIPMYKLEEFICKGCCKLFEDKESCELHLPSCVPTEGNLPDTGTIAKYQCYHCDLKFHTKNGCRKHQISVCFPRLGIRLEDSEYSCHLCSKKFHAKYTFSYHLKSVHQVTDHPALPEKVFMPTPNGLYTSQTSQDSSSTGPDLHAGESRSSMDSGMKTPEVAAANSVENNVAASETAGTATIARHLSTPPLQMVPADGNIVAQAVVQSGVLQPQQQTQQVLPSIATVMHPTATSDQQRVLQLQMTQPMATALPNVSLATTIPSQLLQMPTMVSTVNVACLTTSEANQTTVQNLDDQSSQQGEQPVGGQQVQMQSLWLLEQLNQGIAQAPDGSMMTVDIQQQQAQQELAGQQPQPQQVQWVTQSADGQQQIRVSLSDQGQVTGAEAAQFTVPIGETSTGTLYQQTVANIQAEMNSPGEQATTQETVRYPVQLIPYQDAANPTTTTQEATTSDDSVVAEFLRSLQDPLSQPNVIQGVIPTPPVEEEQQSNEDSKSDQTGPGCDKCGRVFVSQDLLVYHQKYSCPAKFGNLNSMDDRQCRYCKATFHHKVALKFHMSKCQVASDSSNASTAAAAAAAAAATAAAAAQAANTETAAQAETTSTTPALAPPPYKTSATDSPTKEIEVVEKKKKKKRKKYKPGEEPPPVDPIKEPAKAKLLLTLEIKTLLHSSIIPHPEEKGKTAFRCNYCHRIHYRTMSLHSHILTNHPEKYKQVRVRGHKVSDDRADEDKNLSDGSCSDRLQEIMSEINEKIRIAKAEKKKRVRTSNKKATAIITSPTEPAVSEATAPSSTNVVTTTTATVATVQQANTDSISKVAGEHGGDVVNMFDNTAGKSDDLTHIFNEADLAVIHTVDDADLDNSEEIFTKLLAQEFGEEGGMHSAQTQQQYVQQLQQQLQQHQQQQQQQQQHLVSEQQQQQPQQQQHTQPPATSSEHSSPTPLHDAQSSPQPQQQQQHLQQHIQQQQQQLQHLQQQQQLQQQQHLQQVQQQQLQDAELQQQLQQQHLQHQFQLQQQQHHRQQEQQHQKAEPDQLCQAESKLPQANRWVCTLCDFEREFGRDFSLKCHLKWVHGKEFPEVDMDQLMESGSEPEEAAADGGDQSYVCPLCTATSRVFTKRFSLECHMQWIHNCTLDEALKQAAIEADSNMAAQSGVYDNRLPTTEQCTQQMQQVMTPLDSNVNSPLYAGQAAPVFSQDAPFPDGSPDQDTMPKDSPQEEATSTAPDSATLWETVEPSPGSKPDVGSNCDSVLESSEEGTATQPEDRNSVIASSADSPSGSEHDDNSQSRSLRPRKAPEADNLGTKGTTVNGDKVHSKVLKVRLDRLDLSSAKRVRLDSVDPNSPTITRELRKRSLSNLEEDKKSDKQDSAAGRTLRKRIKSANDATKNDASLKKTTASRTVTKPKR